MYKTFAQMNDLLRTAANINPKNCNGKNMEGISAETGISIAMLYKWRSGASKRARTHLLRIETMGMARFIP